MEDLKILCEEMKKNKSLEPIARLADLVDEAKQMSEKAKDIGDTLSQYAVRAESAMEDLPITEGWMVLCDTYKHAARDFADKLDTAIKASRIDELIPIMAEYNKSVAEKIGWMVENDEKFRRQLLKALGKAGKRGE